MTATNNNPEIHNLKRTTFSENSLLIFQLNCNGINNKLAEIKFYLYSKKPEILCLCETFLKKCEPKFIGYTSYWQHRDGHKGGLGMLVRRDVTSRPRSLAHHGIGQVEIQTIQIFSGNHWIDVVNIYNPQLDIPYVEMYNLFDQLSCHSVVMGDFNAHSPTWDIRGRSNATGKAIEEVLTNSNFCLLNSPDMPTYLDHRFNTTSCLDLCIVARAFSSLATLDRGPDLGSDHFPIECTISYAIQKSDESTTKRWKYSSADWKKYKSCLEDSMKVIVPLDAASHNAEITKAIYVAADLSIGKSSGKRVLKRYIGGWDQESRNLVSSRRKARNKLWTNPSIENLVNWKRKRAQCRRILKEKKRESFQTFVGTINCNTPSRVIWKKIKSLNGGSGSITGPTLGPPNLDCLSRANLFLEHYCRFKNNREEGDLHDQVERIKCLPTGECPSITSSEVSAAISKLKNTSPGEDEISNKLLKHLPQKILESLVSLFNVSLHTSSVPAAWKVGITCPILKPGKDPSDVKSSRPITMLSCIGKLMERIVQRRLELFLEANQHLNRYQMGFRRGYSTTEALALIYNEIDKSKRLKLYCIAVYLDLQSAFDSIWHDGLLYKLYSIGTPRYLLKWLHNYFVDRKIKVRLGTVHSSEEFLMTGVPQGAVLSPILFNVMLSDLPALDGVKIISYADDVTLVSSARSLSDAKTSMQEYLNLLQRWMQKWRLNINPQKSSFQIFTNKRSIPNITLKVLSHNLRLVTEQCVLGVILDSPKLTLKPQFEKLVTECKRRLHVLRVLSSSSWGCSRQMLRRVYVAYIRSKMEYGSVLYINVKPSLLKKLNLIQNEAMRCILGARKTSPILSLQAESVLPPLEIRFHHIFMKWYVRISSIPHLGEIMEFSNNENGSLYFMGMRCLSERFLFSRNRILTTSLISNIYPWVDLNERISLELPTMTTMREISNGIFQEFLQENYPQHFELYTDGSKWSTGSTAAAIYVPTSNKVITYKLNPAHSVLGAELFAILKALEYIKEQNMRSKCVIFSDSQSALLVIASQDRLKYRSVTGLIHALLLEFGMVTLQWIKAHCGISGNEIVDKAANLGHGSDSSTLSFLSNEEIFAKLNSCVLEYWKSEWKEEVDLTGKGRFLSNIQPHIQNNSFISVTSRKVETSISRLRIGHAGTNAHLFRFNMIDSPMCEACPSMGTIEHFLLECPAYNYERGLLRKVFDDLGVEMSLRNVLCLGDHQVPILKAQLKALVSFLRSSGKVNVL